MKSLQHRICKYSAIHRITVDFLLAVTARTLQSMKGVKMLGLTHMVQQMIQQMRENELKSSAKFRKIMTYTSCIGISMSNRSQHGYIANTTASLYPLFSESCDHFRSLYLCSSREQ